MEVHTFDLVVWCAVCLSWLANPAECQAPKKRKIPSWYQMNRDPIETEAPKTVRTTRTTTELTTITTTKPTTTRPTTEMSWAIRLTFPPTLPPTPPPPNATLMSLTLLKGILINHGIMPDVCLVTPRHELRVSWDYYTKCELGNYISPKYVMKPPQVRWPKLPNTWYSLFMTDLDAPHALFPSSKQYIHWAVLNIYQGKINDNNTVVEYLYPRPRNGSGNHRIVFYLYKQPGEMNFDEWFPAKVPIPEDRNDPLRMNFHSKNFAMKYRLIPNAINFFRTQFEPWHEK